MCMVAAALKPSTWLCNGLNPTTPVCSWSGVTCGTANQVITITVSNQGLSGTIPSALGLVSSLQSLDLSNNAILGSIPSTLGNLNGLTNLNLGDNSLLTGTVPSALCKVPVLNIGSLPGCSTSNDNGSDANLIWVLIHRTITSVDIYLDKKSKESGKGGKGTAGFTKRPSNAKSDEGKKSKKQGKDTGGKVTKEKAKGKKGK